MPLAFIVSAINLLESAPDLLQAISLSLPTIAIFITLGSRIEGGETYEDRAFQLSLAALLLVVLAAGFSVGYLIFLQEGWVIYAATVLYLVSLSLLALSTVWMLLGRIRNHQ